MIRHVSTLAALLLFSGALAAQSPPDRTTLDLTEVRRIAVLHNGRFKPLDSYAREFVTAMTGNFRPRVFDAAGKEILPKRDPMLLYLEWIFDEDAAAERRQILVGDAALQKRLGFSAESAADRFVSYRSLAQNAALKTEMTRLRGISGENWSPEDREINRLYQRWMSLGEESGLADEGRYVQGPPIIPPPGAMRVGETYSWLPAAGVDAFPEYTEASKRAVRTAFVALMKTFGENDSAAFSAASVSLRTAVEALGSPERPSQEKLDREIRFNRVNGFEQATWYYFACFFLSVLALVVRRRGFDLLAVLPGLVGLGYHVFSLHERTWLSGRALIGTFFESMLFVSACCFVLALVFEAIFRRRWFMLSGSFLAFIGLWGALIDPHFMQPAIGNLPPVLINNFWIHIHVPVIMASYAMVALSWMMGHVWLVMRLFKPETGTEMRELSRMQYWVLPPALILVFAGTVLGGVWADAAWGRFWGWDPKEIGAFVLLVAVTIVVHGRLAGWLKDFGTALGTVCCGFALFVSYYGVNFLGTGLHSYAATGGGGEEGGFFSRVPWWVYAYMATEIALVLAALKVVRAARPELDAGADLPPAATTSPLHPQREGAS